MRSRAFQSGAVALAVGVAVLVLTTASVAAVPAWNAFDAATVSDIFLDVDGLKYTLTLGLSPTLTYLANTYSVNWVQSFCLVSDAETHYFTASGGAAGSWGFDTNKNDPAKIAVAGWSGGGGDRLYPGQSKDFVYSTLNVTGNSVVAGMHMGYGSNGLTHSFKCPLPPTPKPVIPEWSSLSLGMLALPPLTLFRRRPRR